MLKVEVFEAAVQRECDVLLLQEHVRSMGKMLQRRGLRIVQRTGVRTKVVKAAAIIASDTLVIYVKQNHVTENIMGE